LEDGQVQEKTIRINGNDLKRVEEHQKQQDYKANDQEEVVTSKESITQVPKKTDVSDDKKKQESSETDADTKKDQNTKAGTKNKKRLMKLDTDED